MQDQETVPDVTKKESNISYKPVRAIWVSTDISFGGEERFRKITEQLNEYLSRNKVTKPDGGEGHEAEVEGVTVCPILHL